MIRPEEIAYITNHVYDYLIEARLPYHTFDKDIAIIRALEMSCEFLGRLLEYDITLDYEKVLEEGNKEALRIKRELSGGAVELISLDRKHFEGFLEGEIKLLQHVGFDLTIANYIIFHVRDGIKELQKGQPSGLILEGALSRLRRYVCSRAEDMAELLLKHRIARSLVYGFGGVGLISTNIAASKYLSPIGVAASAGLGGGLVTESLKTIIDDFLGRYEG
jgi:hypothetical protein